MTLNTSKQVMAYCKEYLPDLSKWQREIVPRLITGILSASGNPHFSCLASIVASARRHRATIMKFFKARRFDSREDYRRAVNKISRSFKRLSGKPWFLVLDGTFMKRGGFTRIANAIKFREKDPARKGKSTKSHQFIFGALLLPNGAQLPLPRKTYYTKEYCKEKNRKHVSTIDLAMEMIREAPVPEGISLYVLADEYFEGHKIHQLCTTLKYFYIMPVDSRRCFEDKYGKRQSSTLYDRGSRLARNLLAKITLRSGSEETSAYRRISKTQLKKKRVYRAYAEVRGVAGLGDVLVTYSRKQKMHKGKKSGQSYRSFVSNDKSLTAAKVVEYYEMRWQIELFFRELKSEIGIDRFRGGDFQSYERYVDVILMGMLFLEYHRVELLKAATTKKQNLKIRALRTNGLVCLFKTEVASENVEFILEASQSRGGRAKLTDMLQWYSNAA